MRLSPRSALGPLRASGGWWGAPALALFALLRIPSFFEPHWYTDEASYVNVARSLLRGRVLYLQTWNNKPPLQSWTIAAAVKLFGPSEAGLHLLTFISGLLTIAAVGFAATRLLGPRRACIATLICAVCLGLPVVDAELALPESLLIAPVTWAGALLLTRIDGSRTTDTARVWPLWPCGVGLLVAAAIAYQQTAVAEAAAFGLVIAVSSRTTWRHVLLYAGTVAVLTGAWLAAAVATAGSSKVWFALVGFYIPYTRSVLPHETGGVALHIAAVVVAGALVVGGAWLCRRSASATWALLCWVAASLLVAAMAAQPFAHYLTASVAPVSLAFAAIPLPAALRRMPRPQLVRTAPLVAAVVIAAALARVTGLDWIPQAAPSPAQNSSRTLALYYVGAVHSAISGDDNDWDASFDYHVPADAATAGWIQQHGYVGATAVVWSSDAWVYALADLPVLMPTPPIYNDEVLLGNRGEVETAVEALKPALIIVAEDSRTEFPEIGPLLDGSRYQQVFTSGPDEIWLRTAG